MPAAEHTQSAVNNTETSGSIDTPVTRKRSRVVPRTTIPERSQQLMEVAAMMRGETYSPPPPRVPRAEQERRRQEDQLQNNQVYFVYSCNRIKIGTSRDAVRRLITDISPYCPAPMNMIGIIPGGTIVESQLHARFKEAEIINEWFDLSPEVRAFLCEDPRRADGLAIAEQDFHDWLKEQLEKMDDRDISKPMSPIDPDNQ